MALKMNVNRKISYHVACAEGCDRVRRLPKSARSVKAPITHRASRNNLLLMEQQSWKTYLWHRAKGHQQYGLPKIYLRYVTGAKRSLHQIAISITLSKNQIYASLATIRIAI